jgi:hypothetical protein
MKKADILMHLSFQRGQPNILTQMGAIVPVSAMNKMVIRGMNIILLMSTGVIAAGVVIVYTNKHVHVNWYLYWAFWGWELKGTSGLTCSKVDTWLPSTCAFLTT